MEKFTYHLFIILALIDERNSIDTELMWWCVCYCCCCFIGFVFVVLFWTVWAIDVSLSSYSHRCLHWCFCRAAELVHSGSVCSSSDLKFMNKNFPDSQILAAGHKSCVSNSTALLFFILGQNLMLTSSYKCSTDKTLTSCFSSFLFYVGQLTPLSLNWFRFLYHQGEENILVIFDKYLYNYL